MGKVLTASPLDRSLGLIQATALNIANMVGIGPFTTIPLFIAAMNGPQAMIAAVLVICDGLVWSELGTALPGRGGSYHFLHEIFRPYRWGRLIPFLFIWQFITTDRCVPARRTPSASAATAPTRTKSTAS